MIRPLSINFFEAAVIEPMGIPVACAAAVWLIAVNSFELSTFSKCRRSFSAFPPSSCRFPEVPARLSGPGFAYASRVLGFDYYFLDFTSTSEGIKSFWL